METAKELIEQLNDLIEPVAGVIEPVRDCLLNQLPVELQEPLHEKRKLVYTFPYMSNHP